MRLEPPSSEPLAEPEQAQSARPLAVPSGRFNRFARLGSMTVGIAGNMAAQALGDAARGKRPRMQQLLMTPANMRRIADELARMRGAAMKVGQLLSMDTGDVLPPELAEIMARLRDGAHVMPPKQLRDVLTRNWGPDWHRQFRRFDTRPIAAASIGQVHRAHLKDGRDVAIKVQYPGIAQSIDSDVSNVSTLIRMSGLVPKGFDLAPYMDEARRQLHEETDYLREGAQMAGFAARLAADARFAVPEFYADWSTPELLTMSYLEGRAIEQALHAPQHIRDGLVSALLELTLREVFDFGVTQSDPNFANFKYNADTGQIILLDFGATRHLDPDLTGAYRELLQAGLAGRSEAVREAAIRMGLLTGKGSHEPEIVDMIMLVFDALSTHAPFDFTDRRLTVQLNARGMALAEGGYVPPLLPMDVLYLQRKFGGMYLLGSRLGAALPLRAMLASYAGQSRRMRGSA